MPFFAFASNQIATIHLSSEMGESSMMVPIFTGELTALVLLRAAPNTPSLDEANLLAAARRLHRLAAPPQRNRCLQANVRVGKVAGGFKQRLGRVCRR